MSYKRVKQPKISDVISDDLESMILEGSLKPGQKLLSERELAKQFEVSRPSLREAVQKLVAKGLLISRQGGGTFVSDELDGGYADPLLTLFSSHPAADLIQVIAPAPRIRLYDRKMTEQLQKNYKPS